MDNINWDPEDSTPAHRQQNDPADGREGSGDTDAPDIVGRTGEEMPEAAHDTIEGEPPQ